jgi:hypothetical protein
VVLQYASKIALDRKGAETIMGELKTFIVLPVNQVTRTRERYERKTERHCAGRKTMFERAWQLRDSKKKKQGT